MILESRRQLLRRYRIVPNTPKYTKTFEIDRMASFHPLQTNTRAFGSVSLKQKVPTWDFFM